MRITASVLRGFIRETLLREAQGLAGPLPGDPGKVVKNTSVLNQLQKIIGATKSDKYDDQTETAWDAFIDANVEGTDLVGASPDDVKTDWADAAKKMKLSDYLNNLTFTPDIQGMLSFAEVFGHDSTETAPTIAGKDNDVAVTSHPYKTSADDTSLWPDSLNVETITKWLVKIGDGRQHAYESQEMIEDYEVFAGVINKYIGDPDNKPFLLLVGKDKDYANNMAAGKVWWFRIKDIATLDKIIRP